MPSCSDELTQTMREHFPDEAKSDYGMDQFAMGYLREQGYVLTHRWEWIKPTTLHKVTQKELDCVVYLIDDWDFGGWWFKRTRPLHIPQPMYAETIARTY